jgi:hypothetical protein
MAQRRPGWHDLRRIGRAERAARGGPLYREDQVHHVDTYTPGVPLDDLRTIASRLRDWCSALLRQFTHQHVSGQWMEQHARDSAKH